MKPHEEHSGSTCFDPLRARADFPILWTTAHGKPLIYLDNGATTQKPRAVIAAISHYYDAQNGNVLRGVYQLSQIGTDCYEAARVKLQQFINAGYAAEVIGTRGTTEAVNPDAASRWRKFLNSGEEVLRSV